MVVEGLFNVVLGLIGLVVSGFAALVPAVPTWATTAVNALGSVWGWVDGFETWLPVSFALGCVAAVGVCYLAGLLIGVARVVASYLTLGGGAT